MRQLVARGQPRALTAVTAARTRTGDERIHAVRLRIAGRAGGVNLTPDPDAPSRMIAAAGWTPSVGSIQTPVHFFFVPDTERNHRMGATIGMTW